MDETNVLILRVLKQLSLGKKSRTSTYVKCFVVVLPANSRDWPRQWAEDIYFYHLHQILDNRLTQELRVSLYYLKPELTRISK